MKIISLDELIVNADIKNVNAFYVSFYIEHDINTIVETAKDLNIVSKNLFNTFRHEYTTIYSVYVSHLPQFIDFLSQLFGEIEIETHENFPQKFSLLLHVKDKYHLGIIDAIDDKFIDDFVFDHAYRDSKAVEDYLTCLKEKKSICR